MKGEPTENVPESIRLFGLAQAMKWNHLPVAGGLYDQHPKLIAQWETLFQLQGEHEEQERKKEMAKGKAKKR